MLIFEDKSFFNECADSGSGAGKVRADIGYGHFKAGIVEQANDLQLLRGKRFPG